MRSLRNRDVLYIAVVFCISFFAVTGNVYGQAATTSISGRVSDPSGAAIPDAPVTIKNTATSATETAITDSQGRYTVPQLGIGTYDITVTKTGFQTAVRSGVTLTVGADLVIDFHLTLGQANESVNVSGEITQVETTSAAVSSLVNQTQMRELPLNGRDWEQLILLAPGVTSYPAGGSSALTSVANAYSISGTRPEGYSNMLDGEDVLNWWQRNAGADVTGTSLGIDAIAEFQTLTGTYGAQYAGNGGAIVAVTKSGTNEFHGSAYEFLRNSDLDARGFFDPGSSAPPFRRNQFGGTLGGPIKKNKVFFFMNYEGVQQVLDTTYINYVPTARYVTDNCSTPCVVNRGVGRDAGPLPGSQRRIVQGQPRDRRLQLHRRANITREFRRGPHRLEHFRQRRVLRALRGRFRQPHHVFRPRPLAVL